MNIRKFRIPAMIAVGLLSLIGTTGTAQAEPRPVAAEAFADSGPWHLVNRHSGKCLTIQNVSLADNAAAVQYDCESAAPFNENWNLDDIRAGDNYFHIVDQHSSKCLTVANASGANNAGAVQFTCDFGPPHNEDWGFIDVSPNTPYYHIVNSNSGKCLTVQSASLANNARAVQYDCEFAAPFNEEWQLVAP